MTKLPIDGDVLKQLEDKAALEGRTLQETANELLRQALNTPRPRNSIKLALRGWNATTRSGVDLLDRERLFDLMDGR